MRPRTKWSQSRVAESRTKELYDRFNYNYSERIIMWTLFFIANEKYNKIQSVKIN